MQSAFATAFVYISRRTNRATSYSPAVPQQPQPQLIQTPEAPKVQPLSTYIPSTPEPVVPSFDQTTEHEVVSSNDAGDLDIPDFLR